MSIEASPIGMLEKRQLAEAIREVVDNERKFRTTMDDLWEGDLLSDAIDQLEKIAAKLLSEEG